MTEISDLHTALTLKKKEETDVNVINEINQLLCITMGAMDGMELSPEELEEVRERTKAVLMGVKHKKRLDR